MKHMIAGQQFKKYNKASILYVNIQELLPINDKVKAAYASICR